MKNVFLSNEVMANVRVELLWFAEEINKKRDVLEGNVNEVVNFLYTYRYTGTLANDEIVYILKNLGIDATEGQKMSRIFCKIFKKYHIDNVKIIRKIMYHDDEVEKDYGYNYHIAHLCDLLNPLVYRRGFLDFSIGDTVLINAYFLDSKGLIYSSGATIGKITSKNFDESLNVNLAFGLDLVFTNGKYEKEFYRLELIKTASYEDLLEYIMTKEDVVVDEIRENMKIEQFWNDHMKGGDDIETEN